MVGEPLTMRWGDEEGVDKHVEGAMRRELAGVKPFIMGRWWR